VILLMFSVGIHFSIPDLLKVKWVALLGAPLGILLSVGLGVGTGALLGWPLLQGVAVGYIISVASTMVMIRLLVDRNELDSESGRVMITLTLVEDLAVVILTILLPSLNSPDGNYAQVVWKMCRALLLLLPIVLAGWKLVPRLLSRIEKNYNDEISLLLGLTICLVVAAVTELVGLSLALGAFVAGLLLGRSDFVTKLEQQTMPLRDAFVVLFFRHHRNPDRSKDLVVVLKAGVTARGIDHHRQIPGLGRHRARFWHSRDTGSGWASD